MLRPRPAPYADRRLDRARLVAALEREGLLADGLAAERMTAAGRGAARRRTASSRGAGALMMLQIEDALGEVEQANLPGTVDQHPNWRRKLPLDLDELADDPMLHELAHALDQSRPQRRGRR